MDSTTLRLPLSATYSAFFASGLLAPFPTRPERRRTVHSPTDEFDDYASYPESPLRSPSDMDLDIPEFLDTGATDSRRSVTPTPESERATPVASPQPGAKSDSRPRLRRRRSSLTQSVSPINVIKSSTRAAGNALHLQMQLASTASRPRPASLGGEALALYGTLGIGLTDETQLMGRLRSGSCSAPSTPGLKSAFRPRRAVRRILTTPIPAPAPPPTAPLPALPSLPSSGSTPPPFQPANVNVCELVAPVNDKHTSARARGLSVSKSAMGGAEHRIEEMKEN